MEGLEIETKLLVGETGYEAIAAVGELRAEVEQLNVYFDSAWILADLAATFRVRLESTGEGWVTLKLPVEGSPNGNGQGSQVRREIELDLDDFRQQWGNEQLPHREIQVDASMPGELRRGLEELGVERLVRVGWARNVRRLVRLDDDIVVELDRLELPDGSKVYEVEVETDDPVKRKRAVETVMELAEDCRPSEVSKFERFSRVQQTDVR